MDAYTSLLDLSDPILESTSEKTAHEMPTSTIPQEEPQLEHLWKNKEASSPSFLNEPSSDTLDPKFLLGGDDQWLQDMEADFSGTTVDLGADPAKSFSFNGLYNENSFDFYQAFVDRDEEETSDSNGSEEKIAQANRSPQEDSNPRYSYNITEPSCWKDVVTRSMDTSCTLNTLESQAILTFEKHIFDHATPSPWTQTVSPEDNIAYRNKSINPKLLSIIETGFVACGFSDANKWKDWDNSTFFTRLKEAYGCSTETLVPTPDLVEKKSSASMKGPETKISQLIEAVEKKMRDIPFGYHPMKITSLTTYLVKLNTVYVDEFLPLFPVESKERPLLSQELLLPHRERRLVKLLLDSLLQQVQATKDMAVQSLFQSFQETLTNAYKKEEIVDFNAYQVHSQQIFHVTYQAMTKAQNSYSMIYPDKTTKQAIAKEYTQFLVQHNGIFKAVEMLTGKTLQALVRPTNHQIVRSSPPSSQHEGNGNQGSASMPLPLQQHHSSSSADTLDEEKSTWKRVVIVKDVTGNNQNNGYMGKGNTGGYNTSNRPHTNMKLKKTPSGHTVSYQAQHINKPTKPW